MIKTGCSIPTSIHSLAWYGTRPNFVIGKAWMAHEFLKQNPLKTRAAFATALSNIDLKYEPHIEFKKRVFNAIGLIRIMFYGLFWQNLKCEMPPSEFRAKSRNS